MRKRVAVLAMMLGPGCGGESRHGATEGGGRPADEGGTAGASAQGGGAAGASAQGGGAAGALAQGGGRYIPRDSNVPAAGDDRLEGGSFEGNLGRGWDFCESKHPGATYMQGGERSSDGMAWLAFDSQKSCAGSFACGADGADLQVSLWAAPALPPNVPLHLYFDAINLGGTTPSGILHVDDATEDFCTSSAALATIPLRELELTPDWSTRCVSFTPSSALAIFGLYVTGEAFQVGLDAFRFGPPCGG